MHIRQVISACIYEEEVCTSYFLPLPFFVARAISSNILLHCQSSLSDSKACGYAATGMHASISAHLSHDYLMDEETDTWGPNLEEFTQRLGNIAVKERVQNMYFTYLFVLRAVMKAGPLLASIDYSTGCQGQDTETKRLMQQLVGIADCALVDQCATRNVLLPRNLLPTGSGGLCHCHLPSVQC